MITLEHPFFKDYDKQSILELYTCNSFKEFEKNIKTFISIIKINLNNKSEDELKGDIFEGFIELLVKLQGNDSRIGLFDYELVPITKDNGIDAFATNIYYERSLIQIKYRSNPTIKLTGDDLNSFGTEALMDFITNIASTKTTIDQVIKLVEKIKTCKDFKFLYVFTNCDGLHHHTDEIKFRNNIKCFNHNDIEQLVYPRFFDNCRNIIQ